MLSQRYSVPVKLLQACQLTKSTFLLLFFFPWLWMVIYWLQFSPPDRKGFLEDNRTQPGCPSLCWAFLWQSKSVFGNCFICNSLSSRGGARLCGINLSPSRRCPPWSNWQTLQKTSGVASWEQLAKPRVLYVKLHQSKAFSVQGWRWEKYFQW